MSNRNKQVKKGQSASRNQQKKWTVRLSVVLVILLIVAIVLGLYKFGKLDGITDKFFKGKSSGNESSEDTNLPELKNTTGLSLSSVYTSSIPNPDAGNESAEEINSIEVTNTSTEYLVSAEITAVMSDGTEAKFVIQDLPAGTKTEAFDVNNHSQTIPEECKSIKVTSEKYSSDEMMMNGQITVTNLDDYTVEIVNTGDSTLENLKVVYHGQMGTEYFGGTSYEIEIGSLDAGATYTLTDETLLSGIAVVRVYQ